MGRKEYSFFSIPLKSQIFIPLEIGRNVGGAGVWGNRIRLNEIFTKNSKIPLYIQHFILK